MTAISRQAFRAAAFAAVSLMISLPFSVPLANAQPVADKAAQADALFNQGMQLMEGGKFVEACNAFEQSQQIDPNASTLMNLANCREKNNQLATAAQLFTQAADALTSNTSPEGISLRKVCQERTAALGPRLSRLTLRVTAAEASLELSRGGVVVPPGQWNQPIALDGGRYTITAKAPGKAEWSQKVELAPSGEQKVLEVPELAPLAAGAAETRVEVRDASTPPAKRSMVLPIAVGAGAVALGAGAFFLDMSARSLNDEAQDERYESYEDRLDKWESAKTRRYTAQAMGVAAVGAAGVAVYLYLRTRQSDEASSNTAFTPMLAPSPAGGGVAGLQLDGRW